LPGVPRITNFNLGENIENENGSERLKKNA
jgi:hypothetical protein